FDRGDWDCFAWLDLWLWIWGPACPRPRARQSRVVLLTPQEMRRRRKCYREPANILETGYAEGAGTGSGVGCAVPWRRFARPAEGKEAGQAVPDARGPGADRPIPRGGAGLDRFSPQPVVQIVGQGGRGGIAPRGILFQTLQAHGLQLSRYLRP